jgi:hypothetical protein
MRPFVIVVIDPRIESGLRRLERRKRLVGEELLADALVEALDLAGRGRRPRCGQLVRDPILATHAVEHHFGLVRSETSGEDLSLSVSTSSGTP